MIARTLLFFLVMISQVTQATPHTPVSPFFQPRAGLHRPGRSMTVAYMGGSITYGPGWRDKLTEFLVKRWPDTRFRFIRAGIPSLGSLPHSFRLQQDVLDSGRIDLLFLEAAVNDHVNETDSLTQVRALEGIVRHARHSNPEMDIVMMAFADEDKNRDYAKGRIPIEVANQELVADRYRLPSVDIAGEIATRIMSGEIDWQRDIKDLHPSEFGHQLYFNSIRRLLEACWEHTRRTAGSDPEPLDPASFSKGRYVAVDSAQIETGWRLVPDWTPTDKAGTREGFVHIPMLTADTPGAAWQMTFQGTAFGIAIVSGPDVGMVEYSVDKGPVKTMDLRTQWSNDLHLPWYKLFASGLPPGEHTVQCRLQKGVIRIAHLLVNGNPTPR